MVALLLTGVVFMLGVVGPNNQKDEYYVPNFVGKNYEEEIANKQEYIENLSINVQYVNSDEVAEGYVISQDPKEQLVKVKSIVKLEVSSGPKEIDIPQVSENEHKETVRDKLVKSRFYREGSQAIQRYRCGGQCDQNQPLLSG